MKTLIKAPQKRIHNDNRFPVSYAELYDSSSCVNPRMALIDSAGTIVAVNTDWIALARETGADLNRVGPGANYLAVCRQASSSSDASRKALAGIDAVLKRKTASFAMDYACQTALGPAYFRMDVTPIVYSNARAAITHTDITDLQLSREKQLKRLQQFARRLIHAQEEERQRIARELHDDIGNRIALMSLSIRRHMKQLSENPDSRDHDLEKILEGITDLSAALRNLSHGLHPAPLRCLGIRPALKSLQDGFEKTYGIRTDLIIPPEMPRLPDDVELCIFRITQECLQNVGKHSCADKVRIVLKYTPKQVRLTVSDTGHGFLRAEAMQKGGLGLLSMEERAMSIGGKLSVNSAPGAGTEIWLTIPIRPDWKLSSVE
jgi:signal transduction histidine kinase